MYIETEDFRKEVCELVRAVRADISDEYRAFEDDDKPGIQLTVATDDKGAVWNYQTGDNSFTGGAYGLPHWAVIGVYRDTDETEAAKDIANQLFELVEAL